MRSGLAVTQAGTSNVEPLNRIYLDYSAATPIHPDVAAVMNSIAEEYPANPSSVHWDGRQARKRLEESRETIARELGAANEEIYFTSGGTESDNYALLGTFAAAKEKGKNHLIVSAIEHHAVLHASEYIRSLGAELTVVPVDKNGVIDPKDVFDALRPSTFLISIMLVNNEIGTVQPVFEIARHAKEMGVSVHTDAVQAAGKLNFDLHSLPVDLLSISAHKIYGPKGIGGLFVRKGTSLKPLFFGGGQEAGRRPGTENIAAAAGFAVALNLCKMKLESENTRLANLKSLLSSEIKKHYPNVIVNAEDVEAIPQILNISFDSKDYNIQGDALILGMDLHGISVTSGSACTSGSLQPSHVLMAMGHDEATARASIRFSTGNWTTEQDIQDAVQALQEVMKTVLSS
ncbi:MAG: cysteine desulfurase family protein [Bacteroidota bacterium]